MSVQLTLLALLAAPALAQNWATYPQVPKTASINGFADPIYGKLPDCARRCVEENVDNTPCPYWDTGCLCIMPQWINPVADCFAENCQGSEVESASSLANSLCNSVGAWWGIGAPESTLLASAISNGDKVTASATSTPAVSTSAADSAEASSTSSSSIRAASPASSASSPAKAETTEGKPAATKEAAPTSAVESSTPNAEPTSVVESSSPNADRSSVVESSSLNATTTGSSLTSSIAAPVSSRSSSPPPLSNKGTATSVALIGVIVAFVAQIL